MPAIDDCEPQVIRALEKDGWQLRNQPMALPRGDNFVYADLRLQRASDAAEIIIVEVKCFPQSRSRFDELYRAIGQYLFYRALLHTLGQDTPLYLAVPQRIYEGFLSDPIIRHAFEDATIHLVVVNLADEDVTQWIT